ncbi:hypothetical protein C1645_773239 [Glomus cerebriforme]|uniref:Uncharacterized protein n=1 Tax=Glomus cerebriforme TaxID=658196 RepID=A0A397SSI9_9GLOM|nr:hypothetical protein C1645_773239 [Glomus cerebriforme]
MVLQNSIKRFYSKCTDKRFFLVTNYNNFFAKTLIPIYKLNQRKLLIIFFKLSITICLIH